LALGGTVQTMADTDVESLRQVYAEWERGNFNPRFELYAPDWEWEWSEEYVPVGDHVVVMCRYTGRGKGSGVDVDSEGAHLWTLRGGSAVRLEIFSSRERALAAANAAGRRSHSGSA
jgi:ketosteroid isomerase-like protein